MALTKHASNATQHTKYKVLIVTILLNNSVCPMLQQQLKKFTE